MESNVVGRRLAIAPPVILRLYFFAAGLYSDLLFMKICLGGLLIKKFRHAVLEETAMKE